MKFQLAHEPVDLQISIHINNMFNTFQRFEVMSCYDFIKSSQFELIYEEMRSTSTTDKIAYNLYNLIKYYGWAKMDQVLTELFNEEVNVNKLLNQKGL